MKVIKTILIIILIGIVLFLTVVVPRINSDKIYVSYISMGIIFILVMVWVIFKIKSGFNIFNNTQSDSVFSAKDIINNSHDSEGRVSIEMLYNLNKESSELNKKLKYSEKKDFLLDEYRNKVLKPIVQFVFLNCKYYPNKGLEYEIYSNAWEEKIDKNCTTKHYSGRYKSQNKIITKIKDKSVLTIAEIESYNISTEEDRIYPALSRNIRIY